MAMPAGLNCLRCYVCQYSSPILPLWGQTYIHDYMTLYSDKYEGGALLELLPQLTQQSGERYVAK